MKYGFTFYPYILRLKRTMYVWNANWSCLRYVRLIRRRCTFQSYIFFLGVRKMIRKIIFQLINLQYEKEINAIYTSICFPMKMEMNVDPLRGQRYRKFSKYKSQINVMVLRRWNIILSTFFYIFLKMSSVIAKKMLNLMK